ncbi:MAG: LysR substrate-binding domain-containing protein [Sphingomonadaceae bacterium]
MDLHSISIRHFAAMAATVRHGSLTQAARAVNLTQPALSQAISRLESQLECALFDRGPAGMSPTEPATLLTPRAETAISHIGSTRVTGTQMRAFLALARGGSYASASEATGLSAASLHRAVADLSVALGQRLVERRGRSVILTRAGQRRARGFGLAMAELRAGIDEISAWQGKAAGRVVIGAMPLSRARWLPAVIARFTRKWPGVDISVIEGSYSEMAGPLRDGDIDCLLGALRDSTAEDDLAQEAVFDDRPVVIMRTGHPLLNLTQISAQDFSQYPWILPSRSTPLRHYWEDMFLSCGVTPPHVGVECGSVLTTRQLLLAGDALTLLSPEQLWVELEGKVLTSCPPPAEVRRTIGIITRTGWRPTPPQTDLLTILREVGIQFNS